MLQTPVLFLALMSVTGLDVITAVILMAMYMLTINNKPRHTNRTVAQKATKFPFELPKPVVKMEHFKNPFDNPLVGAPADFNMQLTKKENNDIKNMSRDLPNLYTPLDEIPLFDRQFMQMPDPTLMNFRGIIVDDKLPNENLVRIPDFGGAVASNQRRYPSTGDL